MEHYNAVYSLLRTALWGEARYPLAMAQETNWIAVYKELCDHGVETLVVDAIGVVENLDAQLRRAWMFKATKRIQFWNRLMKEQDTLCRLFRQSDIPFAVLKGSSAAVYYSKPEHRAMGDIDLIVRPEHFTRAHQVLLNNDYEVLHSENPRHVELKKNGICLELHHFFASMSDHNAASMLDKRIFDGLNDVQFYELGTYQVPVLPKLHNGLTLLAHIDHHVETALGLRQIIDWMLFVDQELNDDWWNQEFGQWTRKLGVERLAIAVTRMCQMYLGLREDGISWCAGADEMLCEKLMKLTMERGNFGRKNKQDISAVATVRIFSRPTDLFKSLQLYGCCNWKALRKYPFLKPFAWLYQLFRYIKRGLSRRHPFRQLAEDIRKKRCNDGIFNELAIARNVRNQRSSDLKQIREKSNEQ